MEINEILYKADRLIKTNLRKELQDQGHHLSGKLEKSIAGKVSRNHLQGFALHYQKYLNEGFPAKSASFKQFPFVVKYFQARGYSEDDSKRYAAMTIHKWMKEGMPTLASNRFSSTGTRLDFIAIVNKAISPEVDKIILTGIDKVINKKFHETKSETI